MTEPSLAGDCRLVVLWQRFGPYHLARLRGAVGAVDGGVVGLEVAGGDEYAWEPEEPEQRASVRCITLYPESSYASLRPSHVRLAVREALDRLSPKAVAINGWVAPEAMAALDWCESEGRLPVLMSESFRPSVFAPKEWIKGRRIRRFRAALVGGRWHAAFLQGHGFPEAMIRIGYDVVDNDYFCSGADEARRNAVVWRRQIGLPENYLFANSRLLARKNLDGLLRAFRRYREASERHPLDLVVSGSGREAAALTALTRQLGLEGAVHWKGFRQYDELPALYGLATGFAHVAHEEPWGLVLNEACAARLPLIASKHVGAVCELLRHGENGWKVEDGDVSAIADAILALDQTGEERRRVMGEASAKRSAPFSPQAFGEALDELIA